MDAAGSARLQSTGRPQSRPQAEPQPQPPQGLRICPVCRVYEPFRGLTDICCLRLTGRDCPFDDQGSEGPVERAAEHRPQAAAEPAAAEDRLVDAVGWYRPPCPALVERRCARDGQFYTATEFQ